jgi:hypothetical protein
MNPGLIWFGSFENQKNNHWPTILTRHKSHSIEDIKGDKTECFKPITLHQNHTTVQNTKP